MEEAAVAVELCGGRASVLQTDLKKGELLKIGLCNPSDGLWQLSFSLTELRDPSRVHDFFLRPVEEGSGGLCYRAANGGVPKHARANASAMSFLVSRDRIEAYMLPLSIAPQPWPDCAVELDLAVWQRLPLHSNPACGVHELQGFLQLCVPPREKIDKLHTLRLVACRRSLDAREIIAGPETGTIEMKITKVKPSETGTRSQTNSPTVGRLAVSSPSVGKTPSTPMHQRPPSWNPYHSAPSSSGRKTGSAKRKKKGEPPPGDPSTPASTQMRTAARMLSYPSVPPVRGCYAACAAADTDPLVAPTAEETVPAPPIVTEPNPAPHRMFADVAKQQQATAALPQRAVDGSRPPDRELRSCDGPRPSSPALVCAQSIDEVAGTSVPDVDWLDGWLLPTDEGILADLPVSPEVARKFEAMTKTLHRQYESIENEQIALYGSLTMPADGWGRDRVLRSDVTEATGQAQKRLRITAASADVGALRLDEDAD